MILDLLNFVTCYWRLDELPLDMIEFSLTYTVFASEHEGD